jgi:hypothetical protein
MGSKSKVVSYTSQAIAASTTEDKLNAIARAIAELADFVDDIENKIRNIEYKIR